MDSKKKLKTCEFFLDFYQIKLTINVEKGGVINVVELVIKVRNT